MQTHRELLSDEKVEKGSECRLRRPYSTYFAQVVNFKVLFITEKTPKDGPLLKVFSFSSWVVPALPDFATFSRLTAMIRSTVRDSLANRVCFGLLSS